MLPAQSKQTLALGTTFVTVWRLTQGWIGMNLEQLNQSLSRYEVRFDEHALYVSQQRYAYDDIERIHYLKPKKRALIRLLITLMTVALAAWVVLASQHESQSIKLAVGLLIGLTVARFYLLGKVFPKLQVSLKNGQKVMVMQKFDLIAADRIYEQLLNKKQQSL